MIKYTILLQLDPICVQYDKLQEKITALEAKMKGCSADHIY